jgi:hypothetical protein
MDRGLKERADFLHEVLRVALFTSIKHVGLAMAFLGEHLRLIILSMHMFRHFYQYLAN